jgi:hypothetical protein
MILIRGTHLPVQNQFETCIFVVVVNSLIVHFNLSEEKSSVILKMYTCRYDDSLKVRFKCKCREV